MVTESEELRRAGSVELASLVFKDSEDSGMFTERGGLLRRKSGGEAMENDFVCVEYLERSSELGTIPVVVSGEDGRFGLRIDTEDEGFDGLIGREGLSLQDGSGKNKEEEVP